MTEVNKANILDHLNTLSIDKVTRSSGANIFQEHLSSLPIAQTDLNHIIE
jgi:hypothetical protein